MIRSYKSNFFGEIMQQRAFGRLGPVSSLTLGGGGLGQLWGSTTREECIATTLEAVESGINLLDLAPVYGNGEAEIVIGQAFNGKIPKDVRITTKCNLVDKPKESIYEILEESLIDSLNRMQVPSVDIFFLHNWIINDFESEYLRGTKRNVFQEYVVPAFEKIVTQGLSKAWGITGIGDPRILIELLDSGCKPDFIQIVTNLLDSPGGLTFPNVDPRPREIILAAQRAGVPIMGIRAVQAGALTSKIDRDLPSDHPESLDFAKAEGFRRLAQNLGMAPAFLAHQYALSMKGPATVVLGVKNREELRECILAERSGVLDEGITEQIHAAISGI